MSDKVVTEAELQSKIDEKQEFLRVNNFKLAPIQVQAVLDEITELKQEMDKIIEQNLKFTPVLDAPLAKDHPRPNNSKFSDNRMRLF